MPDLLFSLYLLVYFPFSRLWRSFRQAPPKPTVSPLRSYWQRARHLLVLISIFVLLAWHGNYSLEALGLGYPLPAAGIWGLVVAVAVLLTLPLIGKRMERKMTPEVRAKQAEKLRELPFPMPRTPLEIAAYCATMICMTTAWEVFFRGYLLLVLTPYTGMPLAIALSAIAYGAGHGYKNPGQFIGSIVAAFAFTIGYALTGSLWWLIVLHAAAPLAVLTGARKDAAGLSDKELA